MMPDPPAALQMLEAIRSEQHPTVAAELLAEIYKHEHDEQFEEDRGVIRAQLRDLISLNVTKGPK
jgi:hypothetical protein